MFLWHISLVLIADPIIAAALALVECSLFGIRAIPSWLLWVWSVIRGVTWCPPLELEGSSSSTTFKRSATTGVYLGMGVAPLVCMFVCAVFRFKCAPRVTTLASHPTRDCVATGNYKGEIHLW